MESDAPFTTAAKAPPRPLVRYFAAALLLALAVHLLLLVFLAVVVELGRPSPQAAILAFTQAEASGQTPKVSKTLSADEMALPPPPRNSAAKGCENPMWRCAMSMPATP